MMFDKKKYTEWNLDEEPINFPSKIRTIYEKLKDGLKNTQAIDSDIDILPLENNVGNLT